MTIAGIGIDAVDINRFKEAVEKRGEHFLSKIFTDKEMKYAEGKKAHAMHLAGKFAAKEAVKKALPDGARIGLNWATIEILNSNDGKPYVVLHGAAKDIMDSFDLKEVWVSISHTRNIATSNAMVVANGS